MKRLFFVGLLFILAIHCSVVAAPVRAAAPAQELKTVTLKLKWQHQYQFAGYYAALEQGYYRDAGLNVILEPATNFAEPMDAVLRGEAQFGIGASDLILSRARGVPIVAMASIFQHSPLALLVRNDANINSVHDLVGKKLMLEAHADELLAYLKSEGISKDQLTILPHAFSPAALIEGQVDAMSAYLTDEPFILEQAGMTYQVFSPRSTGIDFYGDTLFTTEDIIRQDPEMAQAFLAASLEGWRYAMQHEDEIVDLIFNQYSQRHSREHLKFEAQKMRELLLPETVEIGQMNAGRWQHIANIYADLGMMPKNYSLSGFLYEKPRPATRWHILVLVSIGVILVLLLLQAFAFFIKRIMLETGRLFKKK